MCCATATCCISGSMSDRAFRYIPRVAIGAIVGLVLAACANVPARFAAPEVRAAEVRVVVFDFPRVRLALDLTVHNPNDRAIALEALDVALHVEGRSVARTSLASPVTLGAGTVTSVALDASGDLGEVLAGVARSMGRDGKALHYEIAGTARLSDGTQFPFRRGGVLAYR